MSIPTIPDDLTADRTMTCPPWCTEDSCKRPDCHPEDRGFHASDAVSVPTMSPGHVCKFTTGSHAHPERATRNSAQVVLGDSGESRLKLEIYHGDDVLPPMTLDAGEQLAQGILALVRSARVSAAETAAPERARSARKPPPGRLADPPRPGAYLRLRCPLTRSPGEGRLISDEEYFAAIGAQASAVAFCASKPPETDPETIELRQAWLAAHPPLGWPAPRWRWQWPLMRVPAGMRTVSSGDFALSERALVAGIARGLEARSRDAAGEQAAR